MAGTRKYATLPDLDAAPDIYETPELTDDVSTQATSNPPPSDSRDEYDTSSEDDENEHPSRIHRHRLDPDAARSRFLGTRVDATAADFSDRVDDQRRAYRVSSRKARRRPRQAGDGLDDSADDDDDTPESFNRRIARLNRQAEELRVELDQRQAHVATSNPPETKGDAPSAAPKIVITQNESSEQLFAALKTLSGLRASIDQPRQQQSSTSAAKPVSADKQNEAAVHHNHSSTTPEPKDEDLTLASISARLDGIEAALGIDALPLATSDAPSPVALLPTLASLEKQMSTLKSMTPSSIETLSERIRTLSHDADLLAEKRTAARRDIEALRSESALSSLRPNSSEPASTQDLPTDLQHPLFLDPSLPAQISALHATLPTIDALAPTIPPLLQRLRSLQTLHADAVDASSRFHESEQLVATLQQDLQRWEGLVDTLDAKVDEAEKRTAENAAAVETWVQDLEAQVRTLQKPSQDS